MEFIHAVNDVVKKCSNHYAINYCECQISGHCSVFCKFVNVTAIFTLFNGTKFCGQIILFISFYDLCPSM